MRKSCLGAAILGALFLLGGLAAGKPLLWQPAAVVVGIGLAIGIGAVPALRGYQFTVWVATAVAAAMIYPALFLPLGGFNGRTKWVIPFIVQLVMFCMGTQMSLRDFAGVVRAPRGVLVGIVCHFTVMPLVGFGLTKVFAFPPEIAAGIILVGSCSSGMASNIMAYLARANLSLSVTVTAITTLLAPLLTPLWMKLLAGTLIEMSFVSMMIEIVKLVIAPIGAALLYDHLRHAAPASWQTVFRRADRLMPVASMAAIVYITTVTTAGGRENLLRIGALLFLAAAMHNAAGYFFGYWLSRASRLDRNSARSVSFEVGMQNGAMAMGLASAMGMLGTLGLAAAIFSPWMSITGSVLANYWRRKPPSDFSQKNNNSRPRANGVPFA
jgi:BASS family bile acid:Na+ symporter